MNLKNYLCTVLGNGYAGDGNGSQQRQPQSLGEFCHVVGRYAERIDKLHANDFPVAVKINEDVAKEFLRRPDLRSREENINAMERAFKSASFDLYSPLVGANFLPCHTSLDSTISTTNGGVFLSGLDRLRSKQHIRVGLKIQPEKIKFRLTQAVFYRTVPVTGPRAAEPLALR